MVNQLIKELAIVQEFEPKVRIQHQPKIRTQCPIAMEQGIYKINTNAAVDRANSKGAIAAVCQGSNGDFVAASAMNITNVTDPETLEDMACLEALALAEDCAPKKNDNGIGLFKCYQEHYKDDSMCLYNDSPRFS